MITDIGKMRHRVTLQSQASTTGDGGQRNVTYPDIATVWAAIEPSPHAPVLRGDHLDYPVTHIISLRYAPAYLAARRITLGARIFWVRSSINPGEKNEFIVFNAEEGAVASV